MARRWMRAAAPLAALAAGAGALAGCPRADRQELEPLAAEANDRRPGGEVPSQASAGGAGPIGPSSRREGDISYATGSEGWRRPSGYRSTGADMTFGPGSPGAAASGRWAYNTDSTGADGVALGTGVTYGAATGKVEVPTGKPLPPPPSPPAPSSRLKR